MDKSNHVLILGAGRSGFGAAALLHQKGFSCRVSDLKQPKPYLREQFAKINTEILIGPQEESLLQGVDRIIVSPGISLEIPILQIARSRSIPILSEIDLALNDISFPWIGVTGTNGKSTCTHWTYEILKGQGYRVAEVGNIGETPSEKIASGEEFEIFVVELSSYQIASSRNLKPFISLFTSFSPDHLERHKTLDDYFQAKWQLITATSKEGCAILTRPVLEKAFELQLQFPSCPIYVFENHQTEMKQDLALISSNPIHSVIIDPPSFQLRTQNKVSTFQIKGMNFEHECQNAAMSLIATHFFTGKPFHVLISSLESVSRLPFRFQPIGSWLGKLVINDSKSTNVESAMVALRSLNQPCYLLLGGQAKPETFQPLVSLSSLIKHTFIYGASRHKITADLKALPLSVHTDLKASLEALKSKMYQEPYPVLFSPACASFDGFENFEARGLYFNEQLASLINPI